MVEKARAATAAVQSRPWAPTAVVFPGVVNAEKSGYDYSQELPCFNRKRLEKCSIGNLSRFNQLRRVERIDPNTTRPWSINPLNWSGTI